MPTQPQAPSPANHSGRARLRKALTNLLNDEELRTLCFDLEINYDTLPGREINGKIQELIARFEKAGHIPALIAACRELRPHADWDEIAAAYAQARAARPALTPSRPRRWPTSRPRSTAICARCGWRATRCRWPRWPTTAIRTAAPS